MKILTTVLSILFFILQSHPAYCTPQTTDKTIVNRYMTIEKVIEWQKNNPKKLMGYNGQKVFWTGKILKTEELNGSRILTIRSGNTVFFGATQGNVRNLDINRDGYKMGFKGDIILNQDGKLYFMEIWSAVLFDGPEIRRKLTAKDPQQQFIYNWIDMHNPQYDKKIKQEMAQSIISNSRANGLDPLLVAALITIESAFDLNAVSSSGAIGLGQIMPATARDLGIEPTDPLANIKGCCNYLGFLKSMWKDHKNYNELILASYNAGPGSVRAHQGVPPFSETKNYIFFISKLYNNLQYLYKEVSSAKK